MATFLLGCDHRKCLDLAFYILCIFQHLDPVSVGHLDTLRVNQYSLTVIWLLLLVSFLPRLTNVKLPFVFF